MAGEPTSIDRQVESSASSPAINIPPFYYGSWEREERLFKGEDREGEEGGQGVNLAKDGRDVNDCDVFGHQWSDSDGEEEKEKEAKAGGESPHRPWPGLWQPVSGVMLAVPAGQPVAQGSQPMPIPVMVPEGGPGGRY